MKVARISKRLDRDAVLRTALALADQVGLDAVSLRAVAARIGVTPMALYRYVESKEDLLDGMADLLYAKLHVPPEREEPEGWWDDLAGLARSTRRLVLRHPAAARLFTRPLAGPHARKLGDALLGALRRAGFSDAAAAELHEQLSQMVFALILPDLGRRTRSRARDEAFERGIELLHAGLEARLASR